MIQQADLLVEGSEGRIHNRVSATIKIENAVIVPDKSFNLQQLRNAIPPVCFESSLTRSLMYLARDILYAGILVSLALRIELLPNSFLRILAWTVYMFAQGCVGTGLWILAHECGHGAFSKYQRVNDCIGWVVHSALLVPYFSWKITHARHHRYTGHITKDAVFVPETEDDLKKNNHTRLEKLIDMAEETSIVTVLRLLQHQIMGFQIYLLLNMTSGSQSLPSEADQSKQPQGASHFMTTSRLFLPSQKILVVLSDIGLISTLAALTTAAQYIGYQKVLLLYLGPYLWTHHWLVAITYLHHTHPDVPYHTNESWTFLQGALGTIDRSIGFVGRHFFHEIIDYHVVHHLFPKIPFYYAEAATKAIQPLLGNAYSDAKEESFYQSLYSTFRSCNFVAERKTTDGVKQPGMLYWVVS